MATRQLGPRTATIIHLCEKFGFAAFFFFYAFSNGKVIVEYDQLSHVQAAWHSSGPSSSAFIMEANFLLRNSVLVLFNLFCGILMLVNKKPETPPQRISHIALPFLTTLFMFAYNVAPYLPPEMTTPLAPASFFGPLTLAGALLITAGWTTSFFALWYLRSSFAVFVQGRKLVHRGPYAYVRHPMYSGYMLLFAGLFLINCNTAWLLLLFAHVSLMVYRAQMEENFLAETKPAYRDYMQHTGFLFPKLGSHPQASETPIATGSM